MEADSDIARFGISIKGIRSTVSLDGRLVHYLGLKLGGDDEVRAWVKTTVAKLEARWDKAASEAKIGDSIRANTGVSRAVQREALDELMQGINFDSKEKNNEDQ